MRIKDMAVTAAFTAVICVIAPLSLPIGPVPITLATLMIYLSGTVLGHRRGTIAVILYTLIGLVGIPVFSNFGAGAQKLLGPTGGFIIGYIPCVFLCGIIPKAMNHRVWSYPISMAAGTAVLYAFGAAWYSLQSGVAFLHALAVCAVPFLIGDAAKIVIVTVITPPLRKAVWRDAGDGAKNRSKVH